MLLTISQLLLQLQEIQYDSRTYFLDENYNEWYVQVEESCFDDDEESFPSATVQRVENCYLYADSTGYSIPEVIAQCLYELDLIDEETYIQYREQTRNHK